jgi:hypothetical protein
MMGQAFSSIGTLGFFANGVDAIHGKLGNGVAEYMFGVGVQEKLWQNRRRGLKVGRIHR